MKMDLVCMGGGVKLPALAGAYSTLIDKGFTLSHTCGTSAGAIMSSIALAGYTPTEINNIILDTDFNRFLDGRGIKLFNLLYYNGIHRGDNFHAYIKELLDAKGIKEFGDVKYDSHDKKYQYRLKVIASDISNSKIVVLPDDLQDYGIDPDKFEIAKAVRCSMSIPFFFRPMKISRSIIVDGGCISNFPIWAFDSEDEPNHPTFGLSLYTNRDRKPQKTNNPVRLTKALLDSMLQSHDKQFIHPGDFLNRIISIPVGDTGPVDFGLSNEKKAWLYKQGYDAATDFLKEWSWPKYKRWAINSRSRS
jgi:NTE family protein